MPDESPLERTVNQEAPKVPEAAKKAAGANYFDILGQQFKTTKQVAKTAAKWAGVAAVVGTAGYLGYLAFGLDSPITMGGLILGDLLAKWKNREKITAKDIMVKGIAGAVLGGFLYYAFPAINDLGNYVGDVASAFTTSGFYAKAAEVATKSAAIVGAAFPAFIYLQNNILYNMLDPKFKPLDKEKFMKAWKKAIKWIGLPAALNISFIPKQYQIPGAAAITTAYGFASSTPKEKPKEETGQVPQQYASPSPAQYRQAA